MSRKWTPETPFICENCNKPFHVSPSRARDRTIRYCSHECRWAGSLMVRRSCEHCGSYFDAYPSAIAHGEGHFCSGECYHSSHRRRSLRERFWEKVEKTDYCWIWTGSKTPAGYGMISTFKNGKKVVAYAHHVSWQIHNGEIPDGSVIRHKECDNPSCVNPDHLLIGTHADNMADKVAASRQVRGENHVGSILNEAKVVEIRAAYRSGEITQQALAYDYGVHLMTINAVIKRRTWKHVP